jgi:hypothetical protein
MAIPKGFKEKSAGFPISRCSPRSIRVKKLSAKKRLLICCPTGHFSKGRCKVGTRATKIQVKVG